MSRLEVRLSPLAQSDLADILQYSLQTWGVAQMNRYADLLSRGMNILSETPGIGVPREDWFSGCRCYRVEAHLVLYVVGENQLRVARIFHHRMDVESGLK